MFSFGDYICIHDDTGMSKFLAGLRKCQNHKYSAVDIRLYLESKEWLKANVIGSQSVKSHAAPVEIYIQEEDFKGVTEPEHFEQFLHFFPTRILHRNEEWP